MKPLYISSSLVIIAFYLLSCRTAPRVEQSRVRVTSTPVSISTSPAPSTIETPSAPLDEIHPPEIALRLVASYLTEPTYITHPGDGSDRLFVLERQGAIRVIETGQLQAAPFLDLIDLVDSEGLEQGLLGLAFHPDFPQDSRFFVNYTNKEDDTTIASYQIDPDTQLVNPDSVEILLTIDQPFDNHNGGQLVFGPDGYLIYRSRGGRRG